MTSYISKRYPSGSSIAKRGNDYRSGRYGGGDEGVNLVEGTELAYWIAHDNARRRIWGEHIEYSVEYGPQPPHPQPSTTDKNGDELVRGDLVWFHNQHAKWGRHRCSYTGYVLSTYKGHVQITGGSGSRVIPTCDVWLYHTPKRDTSREGEGTARTDAAKEAATTPQALATPPKFRHTLPPAPEGCRWEDHCIPNDSYGMEKCIPRYLLVRERDGKEIGEVTDGNRGGIKWICWLDGWHREESTVFEAAKRLGWRVTDLLKKEQGREGQEGAKA